MPDTPNITHNLIKMYGRKDWIMQVNFSFFLALSGLSALSRSARILDCGCAMGDLINLFQAKGFTRIWGLDASAEMVEAAIRFTHTPIVLCDVLDADQHFQAGSFNVVIISDLLHHLTSQQEWVRLLHICHKLLDEGGLLVIREPWPTTPLKILYWMSHHKLFYRFAFLSARLQSFIEEDDLLQHFFCNWVTEHKQILLENDFTIQKDMSWLVHRITVCKRKKSIT